jgi:chorismate synthase
VKILSGTFEGRTTGTPISLMIENTDQRSKDYSEVAKAYRPATPTTPTTPSTACATIAAAGVVGARDRGAGGAGAVARLVIPEGDDLRLRQRDRRRCDRPRAFDEAQIGENRSSARSWAAARWEKLVDEARKDGSSLGAVVECVATGVPAGGARRSTASSMPTSPRR